MKYLIEVDFPKDHVLLHRPHTDIKDFLGGLINQRLGSEGVKVEVKEKAKKK